jgi:cytochrome c551/c552
MIPDTRRISIPLKIIAFIIPAIGFSKIPAEKTQKQRDQQQNSAPSVKLINLYTIRKIQWKSTVSYKISVNDKEDGNSEYSEISPNEVLLKVKYFADSAFAKSYIKQEKNNLPEASGISLIKSFNCFTCHRIKTKLIGPSFESVALKYTPSKKTFDSMATRIIKGSRSVWGDQQMPPHPDVTKEKANQMLQWIFKNSADPDLDYLVGLDGIIHTKSRPVKNAQKAIYVLTASYTDHGLQGQLNTNKRGMDMLILRDFDSIK